MLPFRICRSVAAGICSLHSHMERLLLLVMLRDLPAAGRSARGTQGVTFLAMLFSLGWAVSPADWLPCLNRQAREHVRCWPARARAPQLALRHSRAGATPGHGAGSHLLGTRLP